jgi:hypothetical protein
MKQSLDFFLHIPRVTPWSRTSQCETHLYLIGARAFGILSIGARAFWGLLADVAVTRCHLAGSIPSRSLMAGFSILVSGEDFDIKQSFSQDDLDALKETVLTLTTASTKRSTEH